MSSNHDPTHTQKEPAGDDCQPDVRPIAMPPGGAGLIADTGAAMTPASRWPHMFRAWRYRDYRLFWAAQFLYNCGWWFRQMALAWLVLELTDSATWLGINTLAAGLPCVVLLPVGGYLADHANRRDMVQLAQAIGAVATVTVAVLTMFDLLQVWHLIAVSATLGASDALRIPSNQSLQTNLVPADDISNAVALNSMQFQSTRVVGALCAGVLFHRFGGKGNFVMASVLAVAATLLYSAIRTSPRPRSANGSMWANIVDGWRFARSQPMIMTMIGLSVSQIALFMPLWALMPAVVKQGYDLDERVFAQMLAVFGAGAVIVSFVQARFGNYCQSPRWVALFVVVMGVAELGAGFLPTFEVFALIVLLTGFAFVSINVRVMTTIMHLAPDRMRGRTSALWMWLMRGGTPVGGLIGGMAADAFGLTPVLCVSGVMLALAAPVVLLVSRGRTGG